MFLLLSNVSYRANDTRLVFLYDSHSNINTIKILLVKYEKKKLKTRVYSNILFGLLAFACIVVIVSMSIIDPPLVNCWVRFHHIDGRIFNKLFS